MKEDVDNCYFIHVYIRRNLSIVQWYSGEDLLRYGLERQWFNCSPSSHEITVLHVPYALNFNLTVVKP